MKNSFMKKLLSSFLALAMVFTFTPANMSHAVNESNQGVIDESKQAELRKWQEELKKALEAEKASEKLELARVKAGVTKFVTAWSAFFGTVIGAIAGYAYHEKLQLPFYKEKQKLENEKAAKDQEHERELRELENEMKAKDQEHEEKLLKIKQNDDIANFVEKLGVVLTDAGATGMGLKYLPLGAGKARIVGKAAWALWIQLQYALQGLFGENAENVVKSQIEKLSNGEYFGKAWNSTKYHWNEIFNSKSKGTNLADNFTGSENPDNFTGNAGNFTGSDNN